MGTPAAAPGLTFDLHVETRRERTPRPGTVVKAVLQAEARAVGADPTGELPATDLAVALAVDLAPDRDPGPREALADTLLALPDGASFALIGTGGGYPFEGGWAVADAETRGEAAFTAVSRKPYRTPGAQGAQDTGLAGLLAAARTRFAARPLPVRHLLLFSDGTAPVGPLDDEIARCAGEFTCDVLAVSGSWDPLALVTVARNLYGERGLAPEAFAPYATSLIAARRRIRSPGLTLELTLRTGVRLIELQETGGQLLSTAVRPDPGRPGRYQLPTHQWDVGRREYLLQLGVDADTEPLGVDLQLASAALGDAVAPVVVRWETRPRSLSAEERVGTDDNLTVTLADALGRLRQELDRGQLAAHRNRRDSAERHLGAAVQLAHQLGISWPLDRVRTIADIDDAARGIVRLHQSYDQDRLRADILTGGDAGTAQDLLRDYAHGVERRCPRPGCRRPAGLPAAYCITCGEPLR
ncbi:hypothetical protein [Streptomyces candidus]|uniref:VWFA domain-containing protein n=1 Tax=Streptomyces candidus TaxID=67283 RepID=A0A7X0HLE5_9ACTN|nr:hypothetical protein [Streptomyces candidus]MBB6438293.1 hypothetical protein [Streptomyces candidus]GHH51873.1 hypothetical protein GCM10018773_50970 [Streptomyces candidus]